MAIECVNTLEIRLSEAVESTFEETARSCLQALQLSAGCLEYTLTQSTREVGLWWLTGYWESEDRMNRSFKSDPMLQLLNSLVEAGAQLHFWRFVPEPAAAQDDSVNRAAFDL